MSDGACCHYCGKYRCECPEDPPCKNCHRPTHPAQIRKYRGYCLECMNAGVPKKDEEIESLKSRIAALEIENGDQKILLNELRRQRKALENDNEQKRILIHKLRTKLRIKNEYL